MEKSEVKKGLLFILIAQAVNFAALALGIVGLVLMDRSGASPVGSASPASAEGILLSIASIGALAGLALYLYGVIRAARGHYEFRTALYFVLGGASAGLLGSYLQSTGNSFASIAALVSVICDLLAIRRVLTASEEVAPFGANRAILPIAAVYALMLLATLASAVIALTSNDRLVTSALSLASSFLGMVAAALCAAALIRARKVL